MILQLVWWVLRPLGLAAFPVAFMATLLGWGTSVAGDTVALLIAAAATWVCAELPARIRGGAR